MEKKQKAKIAKIAKKLNIENPDNSVSALEIHTVKLPPEPKNKDKKTKRRIRDGEKTAGKKQPGKTEAGEQRKPGEEENENQQTGQGNGEKTKIQRITPPGRKRFTLDEILGRILPPWF